MKKYFILLSLALLSVGFNAYSATLTVTNENDAGSGSLRERIAIANSGDTIIFAPDITIIYLNNNYIIPWISINKDLTINGGSGNTRVTLDASNMNRDHSWIFAIDQNPCTFNINNLILTKSRFGNNGSAICLTERGTFCTATNCIFRENHNNTVGGAVGVNNSSTFTAINCTFDKNSAISHGGAVLVDNSTFTAINCIFNENSADTMSVVPVPLNGGGAVSVNGGNSTFTAINCTFNKNSAITTGGAIYNRNNAKIYLYHCTFDGNQASSGNAISINPGLGTLLYSYNCVYTGNIPQIVGGNIMDGDNLIEGVNAIVTRNYVFGTNQFNGRYITPLPNAKSAKKLDNTIQVPPGMSVDEILNKLAKDQIGNPRPIE